MNVQDYLDYLDDLEDNETKTSRNGANGKGAKSNKTPRPKKERKEGIAALIEQVDVAPGGFNPSFTGSRHEREWILTYLSGFYEDQVITDVLRQVKGGKEATVYCCAAAPPTGVELIAAKVYRPRMFRNLRNDSLYRQGRDVMDGEGHGAWGRRQLVAIKKRTDFGQGLMHMSWLGNELATMKLLYDAGVEVPKPFASSENAILMEYIGEEGTPARTLNNITLEAREARPLFDRIIRNIELMLANGRVHGDLSAHNILYWQGDIKIIDFPQAVDPIINADSYMIFSRDVLRVCQYFARFGVPSDPASIAKEMWRSYLPD